MTAVLIRIWTFLLAWTVTSSIILGQCAGILNQDKVLVMEPSTAPKVVVNTDDETERLSPFGFYENWDRIPNALTGDDHYVSDPFIEQQEADLPQFITVQWDLKKEDAGIQSEDPVSYELPEFKKILLHYSDKDKPLKVDIKSKKRTKRIEAPTKNLTSISLVDVNNSWFMVAISKANTVRAKNQLQILVVFDRKIIKTAHSMLYVVPRTSSQAAAFVSKHGTRLEQLARKMKQADACTRQEVDCKEEEESTSGKKSHANVHHMENPLMAKVKLPRHPRKPLPVISDSQTAVQHQRDREGLWTEGNPHQTNTTSSRAGSMGESSEWQCNGTSIFGSSPPRQINGAFYLFDQHHQQQQVTDRGKLTTAELIIKQQRALEHQYSRSTAGCSTPTYAVVSDGNSLPVTPERGVNHNRFRPKYNTPTTVVWGTPESATDMSAYVKHKRLSMELQENPLSDRQNLLFIDSSDDVEDEKDDEETRQSKRYATSSCTSTICGFPLADRLASSFTTTSDDEDAHFLDLVKRPIRRTGSCKQQLWIQRQDVSTKGPKKPVVEMSPLFQRTAIPIDRDGKSLFERSSRSDFVDTRSALMKSDYSSQEDGIEQDFDDDDYREGSELDNEQKDSCHDKKTLGDLMKLAQWKRCNVHQRRKVIAKTKLTRMGAMSHVQEVDLKRQHQRSSGSLQFDFEEEARLEAELKELDDLPIDLLLKQSKGLSNTRYMDLQGQIHSAVDECNFTELELGRNISTPFLLRDLFAFSSSTMQGEEDVKILTYGSQGMLPLFRQRSNTENSTRSSSTPFPLLKMTRQSSLPLNCSPNSMETFSFPFEQEDQQRSLSAHGSPHLMNPSNITDTRNASSSSGVIMRSDSGQHLKMSGSSPTPPPPPPQQLKGKSPTRFFRSRKTWTGKGDIIQLM